MPDRAARRVLEAWTARLHPAETALANARWDAAIEATPERAERVAQCARILEERSCDESGLERVERSLRERIEDPLLRRAMERLRLRLVAHRRPREEREIDLEAEVARVFASFRACVGEERLDPNQVRHRLRTVTDESSLEGVWRAAAALGTELADRTRELATLRNAHARACGYPDYRAMRLATEESSPEGLARFLDALERDTTRPWQEAKAGLDRRRAQRFGCAVEALRPWHYGGVFLETPPPEGDAVDPFAERDAVDLARRTFAPLGFDIEDVLARSDLLPREAKHPHAFCAHLDREGDVRILANVVPSQRWVRGLLHELGHAVYEQGLDAELPWILRRPPHAATTEGVAMCFGRLVDDPIWREKVAGLPADPEAEAPRRERLLAFLRWALVVVRFEEALYADPERDLDAAWWETVERIQGIRRSHDAPAGLWAAKVHVALWPVYYHAYLMGEAIASALGRHLRQNVFGRGLVANPAAGTYLKERVFRPGAALHWERHLEEATRAPLDARPLVEDAAGEQGAA